VSIVALIFIRSGLNLAIFGVVFAVLSYLRTSRFKRLTGVNPWHIDPLIWAVGSFFIALLGTLLSIIACATTNFPGKGTGRRYYGGPAQAPGYGPPPGFGPPAGYGPGGYGTSPGRVPAPGYGQPPGQGPGPVPPPGAHPSTYPPFPTAPAAPPAPATSGPPAWHPDPTGRHEHRYWDGSLWTEHVSDHGAAAMDPV
jgi:hypothetical protein